MAISLNPVDLLRVWKEHRNETRRSFVAFLDATQKELKDFLAVWMEIRDELESAKRGAIPFRGWPEERWSGLWRKFNKQSILSSYMSRFYEYASTAAGGQVSMTATDLLTTRLGTIIHDRNNAREKMEALTGWWVDREFYFLSDDNQGTSINTVRDAIVKLTREIVALDVLIETEGES